MTAGPGLRRAEVWLSDESHDGLADVGARLTGETGETWPASAVLRGVILAGLEALAAQEKIGQLFGAARLKPGRKRGA